MNHYEFTQHCLRYGTHMSLTPAEYEKVVAASPVMDYHYGLVCDLNAGLSFASCFETLTVREAARVGNAIRDLRSVLTRLLSSSYQSSYMSALLAEMAAAVKELEAGR
jgi:hypothetical protein